MPELPPVFARTAVILLVFGNSAQDPAVIKSARSFTGVLVAEVLRACQSASDNSPRVMTIVVLRGLNSELHEFWPWDEKLAARDDDSRFHTNPTNLPARIRIPPDPKSINLCHA